MKTRDANVAAPVNSNDTVAKTPTDLALCLDAGSLSFPVRDNELANARQLIFNDASCCMPIALVRAHVRHVEERPLASIGLRRPFWIGALIAVLFAIALVAPLDWNHFILAAFGSGILTVL